MKVAIQLCRSLGVSSAWIITSACICVTELPLAAEPLDVWTVRWTSTAGISVNGIACGNGVFIATSDSYSAGLLISSDGLTWTPFIAPPGLFYRGIGYGGGMFFTFGLLVSDTTRNFMLRSTDGLNWTKMHETSGSVLTAAYGNGRLVFSGYEKIIVGSFNSTNWTEFEPSFVFSKMCFGMGRFVATGYTRYLNLNWILSSSDGVIWRYDYGPSSRNLGGIVYGNGQFVTTWRTNYAGAYTCGFLVSSNLLDWTTVPLSAYGEGVGDVGFGGGQFIASVRSRTYTSSDGLVWKNRPGITNAQAFAYAKGSFFAASGSSILQSDVFAVESPPPPSAVAIAPYAGLTITGTEGRSYRIEYATSLASNCLWQPLTNLTLPYSPYLWVDTSSPTVGRRFYRAMQIE